MADMGENNLIQRPHASEPFGAADNACVVPSVTVRTFLRIAQSRFSQMKISQLLIASILSLALAGCSGISNLRPVNGSTVLPGSVALGGEFRSNLNQSLKIEVDGIDVTSQFSVVYPTAPGTFSATLPLAPGQHTMRVSGTFTQWLLFFPAGQQFLSESTTFTVSQPTLGIAPGTPSVTVGSTTPVTITLSASQSSPVTVTLSTNPVGRASHAATTTLASGTTSQTVTLSGVAAGNTMLSLAAPGFNGASATVSVNPGLSALAPTMGAPSSIVTLTGTGFVAGATTVRFGATPSPSVSVSSATSLTATVPPMLSPGNVNISVVVAGNASATRPFTVTAPPMPVTPPAAVLFRSSAQDVQTFTFFAPTGATPASLNLVDTDSATPNGGLYTVGVAQTATRLVRSSPSDAQSFSISGSPPSVSLISTRGGFASGTGSAVAISGTTVVRAIDSGIQVSTLDAAGNLGAFAFVGGSPSATGVAVDILGTTVVRAHANGIDLYSVATPAAPVLLGSSNAGDASAVGTGVRFINATTVVRTFPQGVETYDVATNPAAPTRLVVNRIGFIDSAMGTAVAVEPGGTAVIRATSLGLERYPLPLVAAATPTRSTGSRVSTTGVGVVVVGTRAFRATNDRLEVYNLPGLGASIADIPATVSPVGVGLTGR
jgi:hypothetical protein